MDNSVAFGSQIALPSFMFSADQTMQIYAHGGVRLYVNEAERQRFLDACNATSPPSRSLCLTLAYTGCRISEALLLTARSIDPVAATLAITTLKRRSQLVVREVPVPIDLIECLAAEHDISVRFADTDAPLWPICRSTAWRQIKQVMRAADICGPQATAKGLRHGFGVHALHSGVPLNLLQKWMGHAHISMTAVYGNAAGPEERAIASRMW